MIRAASERPGPSTLSLGQRSLSLRSQGVLPGILGGVNAGIARALVASSSAAVLVLEILAGRLLAPYVGVSLETFTGIIGIVLAGIAAGAWAGGAIADQRDAAPLIGSALAVGGGL